MQAKMHSLHKNGFVIYWRVVKVDLLDANGSATRRKGLQMEIFSSKAQLLAKDYAESSGQIILGYFLQLWSVVPTSFWLLVAHMIWN